MSFLFNNRVSFNADAVDAFNRLKVSNPFTIFDSQNRYQLNSKWDTLTGAGGTVVYNANESSFSCITNTVSGAKIITETKRVFPYQPGKSLLIFYTFAMDSAKKGLRQRAGYFGENNGIYLERNENGIYFVLRSSVTGAVDNSREVLQSEWNGDPMDGSGPSGVNIDVSKANIMWIDIEWLGVGDVRCGFIIDGRPIVAHTFRNANTYSTTYMTTACLPLRGEIENLGPVTSTSTMKLICASVQSEAGYSGFQKTYNVTKNNYTGTTLTSVGQIYPLISLRLNSSRLDSIVIPAKVSSSIEETGSNKQNTVQYSLYLNATISGGSWVTHSNQNVDYNTTASTITGGTEIVGGYINSSSALELSEVNNFNFQLGRTLTGASDTITLAFTPVNANSVVYADLAWYEII